MRRNGGRELRVQSVLELVVPQAQMEKKEAKKVKEKDEVVL